MQYYASSCCLQAVRSFPPLHADGVFISSTHLSQCPLCSFIPLSHSAILLVVCFAVCVAGGPETLTTEGGSDATTKFEETFHSDDARRQLCDWCIGTLKGYNGPKDAANKKKGAAAGGATSTAEGLNPMVIVLALGAVAALGYFLIL